MTDRLTRWWPRRIPLSYALIFFTLATGALFKVSAFVREAFIASRFGLSAVTDAYFSLQQLPLSVATYMFGAFSLAFAPAVANSQRRGARVAWLPGLMLYATLLGIGMTLLMLAAAPWLLKALTHSLRPELFTTLAIISLCFAPILYIGIWSGMCIARGANIWAMSMTGLPYLAMTLVLLGIYAVGQLGVLSLPLSLTAGFLSVGLYSLWAVLRAQSGGWFSEGALRPWRIPEFHSFLRQLGVSSMENAGFAANQLLIIYFLAQTGTGAVSANNCAMRIGMLGFTVLAQPLTQLAQGRLCLAGPGERQQIFRKWLTIIGAGIAGAAVLLFVFRYPVIRVVYMRGKFSYNELGEVAAILPAWIGYFVVMSLNSLAARYLFTNNQGANYAKLMLSAYAGANLLRFAFAGHATAPQILWCSVLAEGCIAIFNLVNCLSGREYLDEVRMSPALAMETAD